MEPIKKFGQFINEAHSYRKPIKKFGQFILEAERSQPTTMSTSTIELENSDQMSNYLDNLQAEYGRDSLFIVVLFDVKNDPKSLGKFEALVKNSILQKKNDVPVKIILQPIPTEYKYTDIAKDGGKHYPMPTHNMLFYYKDKSYLYDFVDKMQEATTEMNIWKLDYRNSGDYRAYIFERIKYGGSCLPDEEELMVKCLTPLFVAPIKITVTDGFLENQTYEGKAKSYTVNIEVLNFGEDSVTITKDMFGLESGWSVPDQTTIPAGKEVKIPLTLTLDPKNNEYGAKQSQRDYFYWLERKKSVLLNSGIYIGSKSDEFSITIKFSSVTLNPTPAMVEPATGAKTSTGSTESTGSTGTTTPAAKGAETGVTASPKAIINTTNDRAFDYKKEGEKYYFKGKGAYAAKYPNWVEATGTGLAEIKRIVKFTE